MTDLTATPGIPIDQARVNALVEEDRRRHHQHVDRLFAGLMVFQWIAGIALALWISPRTWVGTTSHVHLHVWLAVGLGGLISALPIYLAMRHSGETITRHVIAAAQVLWSALLIHLSGGRIETHFHVFGSLAFLAFYRDWRVLITASVIVAIDHCVRGLWWPQSVFGTLNAHPLRWLEHAGWVAFEDIFLISACVRGTREMHSIAERQVALEQINERVERTVARRTSELAASEQRYELAVSGSNDGLWDWDLLQNEVYYSPRFKELLGYANHELPHTFEVLESRLHPEDREATLAAVHAHVEGRTESYDVEYRLRHRDGTYRWFLARGKALSDESGKTIRMAGSLTDITDRKRDERQLIDAKQRAEQANLAKSEFLANMSHELRTPLNAIIGFTDGLLDRVDRHPLNDHQKNRLARVKLAGQHLLLLINDALDIAKVEAGEMTMSPTVFDPGQLAREVADLTEALVAEKEGRVQFATTIDAPDQICSDRDKVKQILMNLLSNAVKFTHHGSINLVVQREGDRVHFSVEDTGTGIPSSELHLIFDKFHQVGGHHNEGGTGLGLSLCKQFSDLLGGVLTVRSIEGSGSTFALSIPIECDNALIKDRERLKAEILGRAKSGSDDCTRNTILCVEDDPGNMLVLQDYLNDAGYRVIPLFDSLEAIAVAERENPDLVVLDIMMPGLDGWELLRRFKANPRTRHLPIILATAIEERDLGLSLGASDYLTKPIDKERLLQALQQTRTCHPSSPGTVAVVDDDPSVRDVLTDLLTDQGYLVRTFENGAQFLRALERWRPDAVVLDLMMPEVDGFGVVEAMRADDRWRTIPTLVLTAMILSSEQLLQLNRHVRVVIEKNGMSRERTLGRITTFLNEIGHRSAAA